MIQRAIGAVTPSDSVPQHASSDEEKTECKEESRENEQVSTIPSTFGKQSVQLTVEGICLELNNDSFSSPIPLAKLNLSSISVNLQAYSQDRFIQAKLGIDCEFYNNSIVEWEPLAEPFFVCVALNQSLHPMWRSASEDDYEQATDISVKTCKSTVAVEVAIFGHKLCD